MKCHSWCYLRNVPFHEAYYHYGFNLITTSKTFSGKLTQENWSYLVYIWLRRKCNLQGMLDGAIEINVLQVLLNNDIRFIIRGELVRWHIFVDVSQWMREWRMFVAHVCRHCDGVAGCLPYSWIQLLVMAHSSWRCLIVARLSCSNRFLNGWFAQCSQLLVT